MRGVTRTTLALNGCQQQQQHLLQHHHHMRAKQLSAIRLLQQIRSLKTTASANGGSSSPINRIAGCSSGQLAHNNVAAAQATTTTTTTTTTTHRRQQSTTSANYLAANYSAAKKEEIAESLDELDTTATTTDQLSSGAEAASAANKRNRKFADACDSHRFVARHIGPRSWELDQMLATLGYSSLEELIEQTIPDEIRFKRELELPQEISEHELVEQLKLLGAENSASQWKSFIGLGYYDCVTPPVILRNIFENPGWTTAYTAYQAEVAQGRLESLMNFQTMIGDLTGLDVANASLLDESTAAAEAMQVCYRVDKLRRQKFLMSRNCHPQTRAVVETRAQGLGIQVDYFDELFTTTTGQQPNYANYCGALIQYPNTHGHLFNLDSVTKPCHAANCLVIAATDLMACALFKPPGDFDEPADLAVGSAQRFGVPLNFGGPHAGFLACRQALIRSIPGRVVGLTRDSAGNEAYRFALQTREQHIRRDKATSNICTAQALLANMSAMYAIYHGPAGIRSIASAIHRKTSLLAQLITAAGAAAGASGAAASSGAKIINEGAYFDTLTVRLASEEQLELVKRRAREARINLRYYSEQVKNEASGQAAAAASESGSSSCERDISISLDETSKLGDVFRLADLFAPASAPTQTTDRQLTVSLTQKAATTSLQTPLDSEHSLASSLRRQTDYLTHPTFNTYHSEAQLVRYMKRLENKDISLAHSMIPLGSCTMKLNATSQMLASSWPEFARLHPFQPLDQCGGYMKLFDQLNEYLCEITGYDRISFQPNSGAQGEYAGLRVIKSYLESINEHQRNVCLIPISAHGTNPASAQMAGFVIKTVRVLDNGNIDMDDFVAKLEQNRSRLACMMVTYPSTFGVFEENIGQLCDLVHEAGGQVYLDGANMNAQVGLCRPGDYGSDVSHLNLHKTFCIPHGGGGPGAGPIGVKRHLIPFLPTHPLLAGQASACSSSSYSATGSGAGSDEHSFGTVSASMWGSPAILPISWSYIRLMSSELKRSSEVAILNANYMRKRLQEEGDYKILYRGSRGNVAHEFILDCRPFKRSANVEANDIAKRLQDFGLHAPTVSWPVSNTLMLEPTESEDKQQLDNYCEALLAIREEIRKIERGEWSRDLNPIKMAPHTQQVVCATNWSRPYTREQAAFPAKFVKPTSKIWPTVGRVDDTFGDTNLFCTCPPVVQEQ